MNKLLRRILNRDKERYKVPRKVQDIIPVKAMWPDGMFLTGRNRYNKLFMFTDINFAVASNDVKKNIIEEYAELINSFGSDFSYKLSFNNRALNRMDFEDDVLMEKLRDTLDFYRGEFNGLMTGLASGINAIVQDKYVMIAVYEKDAETARNRKQTPVDYLCYQNSDATDNTANQPKNHRSKTCRIRCIQKRIDMRQPKIGSTFGAPYIRQAPKATYRSSVPFRA